MIHPLPTSATRHPDPGRIHELARQRAAQLRRETQARMIGAAARAVQQAGRAVRTQLRSWTARLPAAPARPAGPSQAHRPCA